jgi:DNA-directed RNA polymerase specialized sigma24 family protein
VFLLRKIDELSYSDIAQRLGISEKTVQRYLVNAMLHCMTIWKILSINANLPKSTVKPLPYV